MGEQLLVLLHVLPCSHVGPSAPPGGDFGLPHSLATPHVPGRAAVGRTTCPGMGGEQGQGSCSTPLSHFFSIIRQLITCGNVINACACAAMIYFEAQWV